MIRERLRYKTGDWFGVPLRKGGFAVGTVVRSQPKKGILFGYFFGPKRRVLPTPDELQRLKPGDAILLARFGDLGLIQGKWPLIGPLPGPRNWPMPPFVRRDAITGRPHLVIYKDDDPSRENLVSACKEEVCRGLPEDALSGYGAIEIKLTDLL
jgi:hypothetical protein